MLFILPTIKAVSEGNVKMKTIQTLSLLALSLLILGSCESNNSSSIGNGDDSNIHTTTTTKEHISSLSIKMKDNSSEIYATQTKEVTVTTNPSKNIQVSWCFEKGKNNASFEGNEITINKDAPSDSKVIFYAKYNDVESNRITLHIENLDEEIETYQNQISSLESQKDETQAYYDEAKQGYDDCMEEYNNLFSYCRRMGWCNGRDFDPTKRSEWYETKQEMDNYYEKARSYETEMDRYHNQLEDLSYQIQELKNEIQELRKIKAAL